MGLLSSVVIKIAEDYLKKFYGINFANCFK